MVDVEFLPFSIKIIPFVLVLLVTGIGLSIASQFSRLLLNLSAQSMSFFNLFTFLSHKWYFNLLQNFYVGRVILMSGYESF